jgi:hypothetical protein
MKKTVTYTRCDYCDCKFEAFCKEAKPIKIKFKLAQRDSREPRYTDYEIPTHLNGKFEHDICQTCFNEAFEKTYLAMQEMKVKAK